MFGLLLVRRCLLLTEVGAGLQCTVSCSYRSRLIVQSGFYGFPKDSLLLLNWVVERERDGTIMG